MRAIRTSGLMSGLCQEDAKASCCTEDEGRSLGAALWEEARNRLNQILRGWSAYFTYGTRVAAYDAVDNYVYESVRHFLRRRHQVQSRGTSCFSKEAVFGELGVLQLRRVQVNSRS